MTHTEVLLYTSCKKLVYALYALPLFKSLRKFLDTLPSLNPYIHLMYVRESFQSALFGYPRGGHCSEVGVRMSKMVCQRGHKRHPYRCVKVWSQESIGLGVTCYE